MQYKKNKFNYEELKQFYPKLEDKIKLYTLTELKQDKMLKIKNQQGAFNVDALQLREYKTYSDRSIASLWVHPKDRNTYFNIENAIKRKQKKFYDLCYNIAIEYDLMLYINDMQKEAFKNYTQFTKSQQTTLINKFIKIKNKDDKKKMKRENDLQQFKTIYIQKNENQVLPEDYDKWKETVENAADEYDVKFQAKPFFIEKQAKDRQKHVQIFIDSNYPELKNNQIVIEFVNNPMSYNLEKNSPMYFKSGLYKIIGLIKQDTIKNELTSIVNNLSDDNKKLFDDNKINNLAIKHKKDTHWNSHEIIQNFMALEIKKEEQYKQLNEFLSNNDIKLPSYFYDFNTMHDTTFNKILSSLSFLKEQGFNFNDCVFHSKKIANYLNAIETELNKGIIHKNLSFVCNKVSKKKDVLLQFISYISFQYNDIDFKAKYKTKEVTLSNNPLLVFKHLVQFIKQHDNKEITTFSLALENSTKKLEKRLNMNVDNYYQLSTKNLPKKVYRYLKLNFDTCSVDVLPEVFDSINKQNVLIKENEMAKRVLSNMPEIKDLYYRARSKKRQFIFYAGETNSGKTYNAFNEMSTYKNGIYLAPLRLLALEGQEEIEKRGLACSYITGEETDIKSDAKFESSTIEMLNMNNEYECAIIDEVQMISDKNRGSQWLEAILGVNAHVVILTGTIAALPIVEKLIEYTEDELEVHTLEKKTSLHMTKAVSCDTVPDNSAIIAFSRKEIHRIKDLIDRPCSVIYGALSPTVRRREAEKFRNGETKILISTDAIGMGLNLPIENIYFSNISKFNGVSISDLTTEEILQISGRAGRYGLFDKGFVGFIDTNFFHADKYYTEGCIEEALQAKISPLIDYAHLSISTNMFRLLSELLNTENISDIIYFYNKFMQKANKPDFINIKNSIDFTERSQFILHYLKSSKNNLMFEEKIQLLFLPFDINKKEENTKQLLRVLIKKKQFKHERTEVKFATRNFIKKLKPTFDAISFLEEQIYLCDLIHNIEQRFPEILMTGEDYEQHKKYCENKMSLMISD